MAEFSIKAPQLDRRSFVASGLAAAAVLGTAGSLYGRDSRLAFAEEAAAAESEGEWKTIACSHGCGTRCMNKVLVKDGVVVRQKTDDTHEDSIEYPQQRGCLRGRALYESQMGADRLKYPMKRKSWTPEDPHGDLRGKEGYERISWEEALDIVAGQLKKAYTEVGPKAVYTPGCLSGGYIRPLLNACGGYLGVSDTISFGTHTLRVNLGHSSTTVSDRMDMIENAENIIMLGNNPGWGSNGNPSFNFREARDRGAQFIFIGPSYNVSANMLDAKWIPVKPGTDTALLIGVAYEMLKQDQEAGNIVDWDFLHTYCVGFDEQSMPEGAKETENFQGYVLGEYDGVPKTAEWASAITGTPVEDIAYLAEALGKDHATILSHGYASARCNGAEDLPQMIMTIAAMGGHFGKPGHACGNYFVDRCGTGGDPILMVGTDGTEAFEPVELTPLCDPSLVPDPDHPDYVNALEMWDAVITGTYTNSGRRGAIPPEPATCDIRFIYGSRDNTIRATPNSNRMVEALRTVDFFLVQHIFATASAPYADVILPVLADFEHDIALEYGDQDREGFLMFTPLGETPYEAKSDRWIAEQLLERLGYNPKDVYPLSEEQCYFNYLASSMIMDETGEYRPLITITQADIDEMGVEGEPQQGVVDLPTLRKNGIYQVKRSFGDGYTHIAYADFIADPEANPVNSDSGKFEIYCQQKGDKLNTLGFGGETYKPYPTYHEQMGDEGYPLLMFNTHYPRSACSDFDNVTTLREAFDSPVTMNAADAAAAGIETGDPVLVSSPYGSILRPVSVSHQIVPGAIDVPNGAWPEFNEEGIDIGGCPNTLYGGSPKGMGVSGYNNVSVKVEKWTGAPIQPDYKRQIVIEAE
ncbi:MAG: molybdopterin-dependent oxidoreductase [Eggerthellaceae bacterium]|nr:molybdopterin-dependent oxidoreductase [Eggerthellaceae bacterium]